MPLGELTSIRADTSSSRECEHLLGLGQAIASRGVLGIVMLTTFLLGEGAHSIFVCALSDTPFLCFGELQRLVLAPDGVKGLIPTAVRETTRDMP